jgi:hypothetical protein
MFSDACKQVRESVYGILGSTQISSDTTNFTTGTGYMIAPGILATTAHPCHQESNLQKPLQTTVQVVRSPDIGRPLERASIIAEDRERDVAFIRIASPRCITCVTLNQAPVPRGTSSGSLGFPLSGVVSFPNGQLMFNLVERFQGAAVSAYNVCSTASGRRMGMYESDAVSYPGSSGCPAFLRTGEVFAMNKGSLTQSAPNSNQPRSGQATVPPVVDAEDLRSRLSITFWVPAAEIAAFAKECGLIT